MDQGRFTRTIGPDQRVHFARVDLQADVIGRNQCPETFNKLGNHQDRFHFTARAIVEFHKPAKPWGASNTIASNSTPRGMCQ